MPADPRKRQKQQERRTAKRKARQQAVTREKHTGLAERLEAAAKYPVLDSWASEALWALGIGSVCLSRELPGGSVVFAVFLIDRYCLGVKDAFVKMGSRSEYENQIVRKVRGQSPLRKMTPAALRKLVEGAVAYARSLGFSPHADYARAHLLFDGIDPAQSTEELEFGKDGKPLFVAGPNDTPERSQRIIRTLTATCGPDGFHFLAPMGMGGLVDDDLEASDD